MKNKILLSLLLVLVVVLSVSAVAADSADDVVISDAVDDVVISDAADEEIVSEEVDTDSLSGEIDEDVAAINDKIANPTDNVANLEEKTYNIGGNQIDIGTDNLIVQGAGKDKTYIQINGSAQGKNGAGFSVTGNKVTIKDMSFIFPEGESYEYGFDSKGYGITVTGADVTIENCGFYWLNKGVFVSKAKNTLIKDSYFTGTTKKVEIGGKESGAYGIGGQGCIDIYVLNNTFQGQLIDGVSIYGSSSGGKFINNTFKDGVYAIFYGGASTAGGVIEGNTFENCGYVTNNGIVDTQFGPIPIISAAKSADGFRVTNNTFKLGENSLCMILEDGNTKHGAPTNIGDINITDNKVEMIGSASASTVTFVKIFSNAQATLKNGTIVYYTGELIPKAPIVIANNSLPDGAIPVYYWNEMWGAPGNTIIPKGNPITTMLQIAELNTASKKITIRLVDLNDNELAGKTITYSINGGDAQSTITDEDGFATVSVEDGVIAFNFAEDDDYAASSNEVSFQTQNAPVATAITASAMTATAKVTKTLKVTLKDAAGNILANKDITYSLNGETKTAKTDSKGVAKISVNQVAGTYYYSLCFLGDDDYKSAFKTVKVTVNKQAVKATFKKATLKAKKFKKVKFTLKDANGKAIAGKKITVKVNGKTFSAKTNAKGIATIKVKVAKKGKYTATAKFAGDSVYKAITKKAKFTVKK